MAITRKSYETATTPFPGPPKACWSTQERRLTLRIPRRGGRSALRAGVLSAQRPDPLRARHRDALDCAAEVTQHQQGVRDLLRALVRLDVVVAPVLATVAIEVVERHLGALLAVCDVLPAVVAHLHDHDDSPSRSTCSRSACRISALRSRPFFFASRRILSASSAVMFTAKHLTAARAWPASGRLRLAQLPGGVVVLRGVLHRPRQLAPLEQTSRNSARRWS